MVFDRLLNAGYRTLGDLVDARWDGLWRLNLTERDIGRIEKALAAFDLKLKPLSKRPEPDWMILEDDDGEEAAA